MKGLMFFRPNQPLSDDTSMTFFKHNAILDGISTWPSCGRKIEHFTKDSLTTNNFQYKHAN